MIRGSDPTGHPHAPGTRLAEELRLLVDAVAEQAGPWLDRVAAGPHDEHGQRGSGPGASCPLCALAAVIRGEPAELAATVLTRAADLVALLRAVLADRWEPGVPHMPGFTPARPRSRPQPASGPPGAGRVLRIPVRRAGKPVDG